MMRSIWYGSSGYKPMKDLARQLGELDVGSEPCVLGEATAVFVE